MRTIDADALAREIEKIKWNLQMLDDTQSTDKVWNGVRMVEKKVESAPTIDAEPVVRCKDCRWFGKIWCAIEVVDETDMPKENDFCSFAERKDDED